MRGPTSDDELKAQKILELEFKARGGITSWDKFRFNKSLYAVFAVHFGLAALGYWIHFAYPAIAMVIHLLVGISYVGDSTRRFHILRRLFPRHSSQNLLVTFPASEPMRRRIVLMAHADAAYTGWMFRTPFISIGRGLPTTGLSRYLRKLMLLSVIGFFYCAAADLYELLGWPLFLNGGCFGVLFTLMFIFNLQVVLNNQIVAGANDNLSSCVVLPILAQRLSDEKPEDVELVFVVSGCEEAGTGGASHLLKSIKSSWSPEDTVVIVPDSIANGELKIVLDGELTRGRVPPWLIETAFLASQNDDRFSEVSVHDLPVGATDALPFQQAGYPAISIVRFDPELGCPTHYHLPTDDPDHLDLDRLMESVDYVEVLSWRLMNE